MSWTKLRGCLKSRERSRGKAGNILSRFDLFEYSLHLFDYLSYWFECGKVGDNQGWAVTGGFILVL